MRAPREYPTELDAQSTDS